MYNQCVLGFTERRLSICHLKCESSNINDKETAWQKSVSYGYVTESSNINKETAWQESLSYGYVTESKVLNSYVIWTG